MHSFQLLTFLLASGAVVVNSTVTRNPSVSGTTPAPSTNTLVPIFPIDLDLAPTLPDNKTGCWADPVAPPVASNSHNYTKGTCNVCILQNAPGNQSISTIGILTDYRVSIRDASNRDMGTFNATLAAYGGETGGKEKSVTKTVGGKPFHLWSLIDYQWSSSAAVFMDWAGPGPADPFAVPLMYFDPSTSETLINCEVTSDTPVDSWSYFVCSFSC